MGIGNWDWDWYGLDCMGGWMVQDREGYDRDVLRVIVGLDSVFGRVVFGVFWRG